MSRTTAQSHPTAKSQLSRKLAVFLGTVGALAASIGWVLEWIRQRGSCDVGNSTPDTLGISVVLIVIGGVLFGLIGAVSAVVGLRRAPRAWPSLLPALLSLLIAAPIFAFAGAGPGAWFQYCGT